MKKLMYLFFAMALLGFTMCQKEQTEPLNNKLKTAQVAINNSTIYQVETSAVWTTSLNMLTILVKFNVTPATQIYLNSRPAKLSQLKPGFRVSIYYDYTTGETLKILAFGS
jgi:hypothetical protein